MNRTELIGKISEIAEMSRVEAEKALNSTLYAISSAVKRGDSVRITGFGTFHPRDRPARAGRNPLTGAAVKIKASKGISFAPGASLKSQLNMPAEPSRPDEREPRRLMPPSTNPPRKRAPRIPIDSGRRAAARVAHPTKTPAKKAAAKKAAAKKAAAKKAAAKMAAKR